MAKRAIILVAEIELGDGQTPDQSLDLFREETLPGPLHGITLYRPTGDILKTLIGEGAMKPEGSPVESE